MDIAIGVFAAAFCIWIAVRIRSGKSLSQAWSEAHDFGMAMLVLLMAALCLAMLAALLWIAWILVLPVFRS